MTLKLRIQLVAIGAVIGLFVGLLAGALIDKADAATAPRVVASTTDTTTDVLREEQRVDATPELTTTTIRQRVKAKRARPAGNPPGFVNGTPCGGDLPPCWVLRRESNGDRNAYNPTGCARDRQGPGCTGPWQCSASTCDGTGTPEEQDAEARRVWDDGRGCHHWDACP